VSAEIAWYVGCPLVAAGLSVAAVRLTRPRTAAIALASEEEDLPLELAGVAHEPRASATPDAGEEAAAVLLQSGDDGFATARREKRGTLARVMRRGVAVVVRHAARKPPGEDAARRAAPAGLADLQSVGRPAAPADGVFTDVRSEALVASVGQPDLLVAEMTESTRGHGIVELDDEPTGDGVQGGGPDWAARVAAREAALASSLRAREDAERLAREREDDAAALRHQEELERIAVAEQARVRAQARVRRWFVRLDADLDAPTVAQRATLATTLGIRAPWAGKLLREAFAQEEEPQVRARIVGALVAGDHLEVPEPFEIAFARGGIERAAVWETLRPRLDEAAWIAEVLAPLLDAMEAA
jgi:hypothetical protein